jgi:hypothetical protein
MPDAHKYQFADTDDHTAAAWVKQLIRSAPAVMPSNPAITGARRISIA